MWGGSNTGAEEAHQERRPPLLRVTTPADCVARGSLTGELLLFLLSIGNRLKGKLLAM